jgi:hypothetical protein
MSRFCAVKHLHFSFRGVENHLEFHNSILAL